MTMNYRTIMIALSVLGMATACGGPGESAQIPEAQPAGVTSKDIGDHVVHFSAQLTDQLSPEIARAYNIVRSNNIAMLSVSVLSKTDNKSVPAEVTVQIVNLTGQLKDVTMQRIDEQEAIYYIGKVPVANRETLNFDISVKPEGVDKPSKIRFQREFYTD